MRVAWESIPAALFASKGVEILIELDESEFKNSYVEDSVLIAILSYYADDPLEGQRIKDQLLYEGDAYGLSERSVDRPDQAWVEPNNDRHRADGPPASEWRPEDHPAPAAETVPP